MQKLFGVIESNVTTYQDILKSTFFSFLTARGASTKTQKNYWSDTSDFISWFIAATSQQDNPQNSHPRLLLQPISQNHVNNYVRHLINQNISKATVNRRLSSLRTFFDCIVEMKWLAYHPMTGIANIKTDSRSSPSITISLLKNFEDHLRSSGAGKATIKNYVSDVRQFLHWLEQSGRLSRAPAYGRK